MFRFRRAPLMWALFALLWMGSDVAAQEKRLFAVDGARGNPSTLYVLDRTNGSIIETIGPTGFSHVTAIDFDPTGVLYGIFNDPAFAGGAATLITIDPDTGIGTFVADISWDPELPGLGENVPDMSFDSGGALYVWREPFSGDDLYNVDLLSGVATLVGEAGLFTFSTGLAFDLTGDPDDPDKLYVKTSEKLFEVDPLFGAGVDLVPFDIFAGLNMLAVDEMGTLYTASRLALEDNPDPPL